ncbi:hypothetical protein Hanom_Chr09g00780111 [Helianthus anomalus]
MSPLYHHRDHYSKLQKKKEGKFYQKTCRRVDVTIAVVGDGIGHYRLPLSLLDSLSSHPPIPLSPSLLNLSRSPSISTL